MQTIRSQQHHRSLKSALFGFFLGAITLTISGQASAGFPKAENVFNNGLQPKASNIFFTTPVKYHESKAVSDTFHQYNPPSDPVQNDPDDSVPTSIQGDTATYDTSSEVRINVCSTGPITTYKIYANYLIIQAPCFNSQQIFPITGNYYSPFITNSSTGCTITFPNTPKIEVIIGGVATKKTICFSDGRVDLP